MPSSSSFADQSVSPPIAHPDLNRPLRPPEARSAVRGTSLAALRLRRALRLAPGLILAWTTATLLAVRLSGVAQLTGTDIGDAFTRSLVVGLLVGLSAAWLEANVLPRWARRLPLAVVLVLQTVVYVLVVFIASATVVGLIWVGGGAPGLTDLPEIDRLLRTWAIGAFFTLLILSSFLINLAAQLRLVLGPAMLIALLIGRYRKPVVEERAFLFLDLTDSTAIAEALGPLRFTQFKNDFFGDVAGPVLDTGGRIVQYVGDEVMVTWPMRRAVKGAAPIRFFFLVERTVKANRGRYLRLYGFVPQFKAGTHGGEVVTAQVGDLRRDIVHSGDVVNTASRIEGECRTRERRLLISADLLHQMSLPYDLHAEDLGSVSLRGKEEPVHLYSIERLPSGMPLPPSTAGPAR